MAKRQGGESLEPQKLRVETSWLTDSRELDDLARVAKRISGNPGRRGEAAAYLIRLWSEVLHGEISPATFWEMFGVTASPAAAPPVAQQSALPPASAREAYTSPPAIPETQPTDERRANLQKNRKAAADQWGN